MAYSAQTFSAFETPTTAKWNLLWSNDASFHDGTGIDNDVVLARHLINGQIYRRQGGSSTVWDTTGTTTYDVSATDVKWQGGKLAVAADNSNNVVTFPVAYTYTPLVFVTPSGSGGLYPTWYLVTQNNTGFTFRAGANMAGNSFAWIAVGV